MHLTKGVPKKPGEANEWQWDTEIALRETLRRTWNFQNSVHLVLKAVSSFEKKGALICSSSHWLVASLLVCLLPLIYRIPNTTSIVPLDPKPVTISGTVMRSIRRPASSLLGSLCPEPTLQAPSFKSFKSWVCTGGKLLYKVINKHWFPCWVHSNLLGTMRRLKGNKIMALTLWWQMWIIPASPGTWTGHWL